MMNRRSSNRYPFTPSQWQELEHQALIYKYMASGSSIPPHLLFPIKTNTPPPPPFSPTLWEMGLGRKMDPEPGRCRRTDGKKWRCSKEAYPNSKYCERHMHRGKNRSRKPVELFKTSSTTTNASSSSSSSVSYGTSHLHNSFLYHHHNLPPSTSAGLSLQDNNCAPLFLDTASFSSHTNNTDCRRRNRYVYGVKEDVDEHAFFTEPSGAMKSFSCSSIDDSTSCSNQRSSGSSDYSSYLQLQSLGDHSKQNRRQEQEQDQGFYLFGKTLMKLGKQEPKTVHRFFDEWPHRGRGSGSWLDLDDNSSTTQLSISIPTSAHDFRSPP